MKFLNYLRNNKTLPILVFVILSIFIIGIIGNKIINNLVENWPTTIEERTDQTAKLAIDYLGKIQQDLIVQKKSIKEDLNNIDSLTFENINESFSKINIKKNLLGVFNKESLLFWNENYDQQIILDDTLNFNYGETFFLNSGIDTYLLIKDSLNYKNQKIKFVFGKIIEKEYELNPDYFERVSLTKDLSDQVNNECKINYYPKSSKNKDGRKYSFDINNNKNKKIGSVIFIKQTREKSIKTIEDSIFVIQSLLAILGYLLFGLVLFQKLSRTQNLFIKFIFISIYFIAFRYLFVLVNFPKIIITSDLLNDKIYYSNFIFGLADSPLELFLTLCAFLIIFYKACQYSIKFLNKETHSKIPKTLFFILFIVLLIFYLVSLRGFSAAIRSFVFDTSIRYFQNPSLNLTSEHLLMHVNVLIIGLISILGSVSFVITLIKYYKYSFSKKHLLFLISSLAIFIGSIILYDLIQSQPQSTILIKSIHATLVFVIAYIISSTNLKLLSKIIIIYLAASFISILSLLFYNSELERESLKTTATVISRVNDEFYKSLISETLLDDFSRRKAIEAFENSTSNFNSYAFMIWSKSNLQKESLNSSVNFIDLNGNLLGGFGSIYPKVSIEKIVDTNTVIEEIQIFEELFDNESQKILRGIIPIKDEFAFLGYLDVSILSDLNDFGFNSHPEFISSGTLNEKAILKLDKLTILDYRNNDLKIVYGDINPSAELNLEILSTKLTNKNDAWLDTDIKGSEYIVYIKKVSLNKLERVLAVALREKDLSIGLFDFFKVFFTHLIFLLLTVIIYALLFYRKEKIFHFDLRAQLLAAFLIISLMPLLLIAFFFRDITENKNEEATYYKLGKRAFSIESYLVDHSINNGNSKLPSFANAAKDLNINFSVYSQNQLEYSSDDLIYDVGLIPKILNPNVYKNLIVDRNQEIMLKENIDKFKYSSFYYKSNMFDSPMIIKVSEGFNKILMPLSGSEVDVFLFGTYSLAAIFIILFSALLANRISSPIRKLTYATKSVAAGDLSLEIKTNAKGEVKELVSGFQYMIKELKRNQTILAEIEREEAWKEMAKQVAHEIKNPLTPMKLSVQQLITAYDDKSDKFDSFFKKVTATILNQIEALKNIATEFSNFARMPKLKVEQINCIEIINQSRNLFTDEKILIEFKPIIDKAKIQGDSEQLRRTFINLIRNSIQANSTKIIFDLTEKDYEFILKVTDNGNGIKPEELTKIFEPNFTTKTDGMGLGLSMAKRYLRSTGSDISVLSSAPEGTTFQINFPKQ